MDPKTSPLDFSALATVTAAHNLQNLLAVIARCADAIAGRSPGPVRAHAEFRELDAAIGAAFQLSSDLLAAVGLQPPTDPVVFDLNALLLRYRGILQRLLGVDIRLEVTTCGETLLVEARPVQLEWLLLNLAANGRDAMPRGGRLFVDTSAVDLPASVVEPGRPTSYARLLVRDEGGGVPPIERAELFEPFFTTRPLGTGLGLTSVAVTVRELGGTVTIESDRWSGATVDVVLPRQRASAPPDENA